jgi:hypothetical protein
MLRKDEIKPESSYSKSNDDRLFIYYESLKTGYDIVLLTIESEEEKEKFKNDSRFQNYPILFKYGSLYSIYIKSSRGEWRIVNRLDANKFQEIEFPEHNEFSILRAHRITQEIYDEITSKNEELPLSSAAFKNNLQMLKGYSFSVQRIKDNLIIECKNYPGAPRKAEKNLGQLAQSFKSALADIGIEEKKQYEIEIKRLKLTIISTSTEREKNLTTEIDVCTQLPNVLINIVLQYEKSSDDTLPQIIKLFEAVSYPQLNSSYFHGAISQIKASLFSKSPKNDKEDNLDANITCRIQ